MTLTTFIIAAIFFLVFVLALSLGALFGGRRLEGGSCRNTRRVMGEDHLECCGAHDHCRHLEDAPGDEAEPTERDEAEDTHGHRLGV